MSRPFEQLYCYTHTVSYHETDAMGVVHHSNYLKMFEDARVAWIRDNELSQFHYPKVNIHWAVVETRVFHDKPAFFGAKLLTYVQARRQKLKICFQYVTVPENRGEIIARAETILVPVNENQKPTKLSRSAIEILEKQKWIETLL